MRRALTILQYGIYVFPIGPSGFDISSNSYVYPDSGNAAASIPDRSRGNSTAPKISPRPLLHCLRNWLFKFVERYGGALE
jgi:hypothetical protein